MSKIRDDITLMGRHNFLASANFFLDFKDPIYFTWMSCNEGPKQMNKQKKTY